MRRCEIAIRTAVGAAPSDVLRLVMGRGLALAAMGVVLGLVAGLAVSRVLTSLVAGADARDPVGLAAAVLVLLAAATLACWLPARRALAIDPAAALRE
ncbi:MAG: FtsX-like permease family protein [Vicinamibacterales bacterium]